MDTPKDNTGQSASPENSKFEYGWCYTDHKEGKEIRSNFRSIDYMNDEPYASRVKDMLEQLGLPQPEPEQIFRGTHHDLLFLNSHGVVIRIGHADIEDLMNPAIVQPLGWIEDKNLSQDVSGKKLPFTVSIGPGVELYKSFLSQDNRPELVGNLRHFLQATNQGASDVSGDNMGVIRVLNDDGEEIAIPMLLDADNRYNSSSQELSEKRSSKFRETQKHSANRGEAMSHTLQDVFSAAQHVKLWQRAFQLHQPLRNKFWRAFHAENLQDGKPDQESLDAFWEQCASVINNPKAILMHHWTSRKTESGINVFKRSETYIPNLVLYRPWTGNTADQTIMPAKPSERLKLALNKKTEEAGVPSRPSAKAKKQDGKDEKIESERINNRPVIKPKLPADPGLYQKPAEDKDITNKKPARRFLSRLKKVNFLKR